MTTEHDLLTPFKPLSSWRGTVREIYDYININQSLIPEEPRLRIKSIIDKNHGECFNK